MINDPHFFENTHNSIVRCSPSNTTKPHKDQDFQIQGKLLLILKVHTLNLFVYENHNIITSENKIVDIQPKTDRNKPNEEIIKEQLQSYKEDSMLNFGDDIKVLAYNPNEYTKGNLLSQTI